MFNFMRKNCYVYLKLQMNSVDKNTNEPLSHTVSALERETMYVFSVTARTQDDWGKDATVEVYTISSRGM